MKPILQFKSVRNRLLFWFLTLTLLPLLAVSIIIYQQRVHYIKEEAFEKLLVVRELKVKMVNLWLDEKLGDIKVFSVTHKLRGLEETYNKKVFTKEDQDYLEKTRQLLRSFQESYQDYEEIFIINPISGKIDVSSNKANEGVDKSKDPYFIEPLRSRETYIKDIFYSATINKPSMTFSRPIFCLSHGGEHIVGILVMRINLGFSLFDMLLDRTGMGESGETLIVNRDLMALNELRWHKNGSLLLKIEAKPALLASQGKTGIMEAIDYRGEKVLVAYTHISRTGWGFIAKQDLKEVYAPGLTLLWNILLVFLAAGVVSSIGALFLARTISKPIREMADVSKRVRKGEWEARSDIKTSDELGYLSETLNHTADSMLSQINIQQGVAAITETMVKARSLDDLMQNLLKKLVEVTDFHMGAIYQYNPENNVFEPLTSLGVNSELLKPFDGSIPEGEFGRAITTKRVFHLKDIPEDTSFIFKTFVGDILPREMITLPIVIDDQVMAMISLARLNVYNKRGLEILNQVSLMIHTAYSNQLAVGEIQRLSKELEVKNQELQSQADELQLQSDELQQQAEELQEQNIELDLQRKQVEEADRLKSEFLSNMSHELRTPLNSILVLSRVLILQAREKLSEEEWRYLEIIERSGKNLLNLINDILDLSKIEAGRMEISPKLFSLNSTIEVIMERLMPMAEAKGLRMETYIPSPLPPIESDEVRVHQILQNIVSNAVKFTEQGTISVSARSEEEEFVVEITDTGIGIPEKDLPYIFYEFRQVDGSSTRKYEGTGLGLAIAKKMARLLGGNISVTSEWGKGSKFTLTLPVRWSEVMKPLPIGPPEREGEREWTSLEDIERLPGEVEGKEPDRANRILLVEDNEPAIIQMRKILEMEGYDVDVARNGMEAIDYVQHTIPDGIILDLMMPELNGFEVLEKIRGQKETARIPVLILTAKDLTPEDLKRLETNHIQQLVQKGDVDQKELLSRIRFMLEKQTGSPATSTRSKKETERPIVSKKGEVKRRVREIPTILIVEDNPDHLTALKALLQSKYTLLEATSGEQGLEKTLSDRPDLILLDMALPDMEGITVVRIIKEDPETCSIPVIAVTAQAMKGEREKFIEAGCDDYVSKPYDPEDFIKKIGQWLEK